MISDGELQRAKQLATSYMMMSDERGHLAGYLSTCLTEIDCLNSKRGEAMNEPTFDSDGYPTQETLKAIENWDADAKALLVFVQEVWKYPERAQNVRPGIWAFSTGGWSGNESLMAALHLSMTYTIHLAWDCLYAPGGHYVFALGEEAKQELQSLIDYIIAWAWKRESQQEKKP